MADTTISIIIPAYNVENYIESCLESVVNQTYKSLEIVIVDDGSTDNTAAIIDKYAAEDTRIVVIHKYNSGVTEARLKGVEAATGEYIGFLDSDDEIEPNMFETLLENAVNYGADISHCGYQMMFPDGRVDYYYGTDRIVFQDKLTGLRDLLEGSFIEPGLWNKLYKRSLFTDILSNNKMDTSIKINEDLLMNYFLFQNSHLAVFYDKCFYHYKVHKNSAATSELNENKLLDPLRVTRILLRETIDKPVLYGIVEAKWVRQLIGLATMPAQSKKELVLPQQKKAQKELRKNLFKIIRGNSCNLKLKTMAVVASLIPKVYCWIKIIYGRITRLDQKYSVE